MALWTQITQDLEDSFVIEIFNSKYGSKLSDDWVLVTWIDLHEKATCAGLKSAKGGPMTYPNSLKQMGVARA